MFLCFVSENVCHFISCTPRKCFDRTTCVSSRVARKQSQTGTVCLEASLWVRDGQLEAIRFITDGNDTLVLIPTGGGKSVVYTVVAVLMQGLTVVIEPLKFIMEEQAGKLRLKQVPAFYYNSSLTDAEMDFVVNTLCRRDLPYAILFTSPECIMSSKLQNVLKTWSNVGKLSFVAVDEAHCVDVWGHGFRPDFLKLGNLKDFTVPVIALTGTATEKVMSSIVSTLAMTKPSIMGGKNLFLSGTVDLKL